MIKLILIVVLRDYPRLDILYLLKNCIASKLQENLQ